MPTRYRSTMRLTGSILMTVGVFFLIAAVLAAFGPTMRTNGVDVFATVTSVKGVSVTGAFLLVLGASMRRLAVKRATREKEKV